MHRKGLVEYTQLVVVATNRVQVDSGDVDRVGSAGDQFETFTSKQQAHKTKLAPGNLPSKAVDYPQSGL